MSSGRSAGTCTLSRLCARQVESVWWLLRSPCDACAWLRGSTHYEEEVFVFKNFVEYYMIVIVIVSDVVCLKFLEQPTLSVVIICII